jgi:CRISPR-associated protein Cmr4
MYQTTQTWFLYAISPVHMGAGNAVGELVDSPIQREAHTAYPVLPASGIKGALRHRAEVANLANTSALYGAKPDGDLHAGALTFTDGSLIAFPVRTLTGTFAYVTSLVALARINRQLNTAGHNPPPVPTPSETPLSIDGGARVLETLHFEFSKSPELAELANWLAERIFPADPCYDYFRAKFSQDLLALPDEDFTHFVRNSTSIEPHVRINDSTGTAKDGGLFYVENLPPESVFLSTALFSNERTGRGEASADTLAESFAESLDDQMVQIGGDATYGRGHVIFHRLEA